MPQLPNSILWDGSAPRQPWAEPDMLLVGGRSQAGQEELLLSWWASGAATLTALCCSYHIRPSSCERGAIGGTSSHPDHPFVHFEDEY